MEGRIRMLKGDWKDQYGFALRRVVMVTSRKLVKRRERKISKYNVALASFLRVHFSGSLKWKLED